MVSLEGTYTLIKVAIVHDWLVTYAGAEKLPLFMIGLSRMQEQNGC